MKIYVYTAVTGGYDSLNNPPADEQDVKYVAFLDSPPPHDSAWEYTRACNLFSDPCRNARFHKVLSHEALPEAAYSIWIDGSIRLNRDFSARALVTSCLRRGDLAVFSHRWRGCIYDEGIACAIDRKDNPALILRQLRTYAQWGYPKGNGLADTSVVLRRHSKAVAHFNEVWHKEILAFSRRDQISFMFAAAICNLQINWIPGSARTFRYWKVLHHRINQVPRPSQSS